MNKTVNIVIPCRNERVYIAPCIQSILDSRYPNDLLEILVCDGMSDDGTREIIQSFESKSNVKLLDNLARTTPQALNLGINNNNSDIVIILGAHAEIHPDYVRLCVETLERFPEAGCVGGVLETVSEDNRTAAIAKAMSSTFGVGNAHFRTGANEGWVDTVAFGAYRREVFEKSGLFDEVLVRNQDDEFNYRILRDGFKIYLQPAIQAKYFVRSSFQKLFKQYRQYGYWKVYVNRKHGAVTTIRQLAPPLFVLFLASMIPAWLIHPYLGVAHTSLAVIYVLASLLSAAKQSENFNELLRICLAFYTLHFSYGLGYIEGFFDFMVLRKKDGARNTTLNR